jgi:hypothetical protein
MSRNLVSTRLLNRTFYKSLRFNGSSASASVALNLSAVNVVSIAFWIKWDAYKNTDQLLFEFTANYNPGQTGGFILDPDTGGRTLQMGINGNAGYNFLECARFSAGKWHHVVTIYDKSQASASEESIYIDGINITSYTKAFSNNNTNNFANSTLYLMSRNNASLFAGGNLAEFIIYTRSLSQTEITNLYIKGIIPATPIVLYYFNSDALDSSGNGNTLTLNGTTYSSDIPISPRTLAVSRSTENINTRTII